MSPHIPALNEIPRQALDHEPKFPDDPKGRMYMILFPEDFEEHGIDMAGNVALLLDREQAVEVRDLAADIVDELDERAESDGEGER